MFTYPQNAYVSHILPIEYNTNDRCLCQQQRIDEFEKGSGEFFNFLFKKIYSYFSKN